VTSCLLLFDEQTLLTVVHHNLTEWTWLGGCGVTECNF